MEKAVRDINSMIDKGRKAQEKFLQGTSQHTLQRNRISALEIAVSLITCEGQAPFSKEDLQKAVAPIESLISKSRKAQKKLSPDKRQYTMLEGNIRALNIALPLIKKALEEEHK